MKGRAIQAVVRGAKAWVVLIIQERLQNGQKREVNGWFLCHLGSLLKTQVCQTCQPSKSMLKLQVYFVLFQKCGVFPIQCIKHFIFQCLSMHGRISIFVSTIYLRVPLLNITWKCKSLGLKEDTGYVTAMLFLDYATPNASQKIAYLTRCDCFLCVSISFLCCIKSLQYLTGRECSWADLSLQYCSFAAGRC